MSIKDLRKAARKQGWTERTTGSGHVLLRSPSGKTVTLPSTPSGGSSHMKQWVRYMVAAGLAV